MMPFEPRSCTGIGQRYHPVSGNFVSRNPHIEARPPFDKKWVVEKSENWELNCRESLTQDEQLASYLKRTPFGSCVTQALMLGELLGGKTCEIGPRQREAVRSDLGLKHPKHGAPPSAEAALEIFPFSLFDCGNQHQYAISDWQGAPQSWASYS